jgi:ABC-2 type transport system ATP-binding protein
MASGNNHSQNVVLQIDRVNKNYIKKVPVNEDVSLSIHEGEIFGLLGPNGAGKTTLVNQIIGLVKPDSGTITIDETDVIDNPGYARQACSFQAQTQVPITGLSAKQAIELVGRVRGGQVEQVRQRTRGLIDSLEMGEWEDKPGETFSGGVRRLVAFCMAAVVPGRIVILDEPTNDVDPLRRRLLWKQIRDLSENGSAILLVTHNVLEAEHVVDRLSVMNGGKIQRTGRPAELKEQNGQSVRMEVFLEPGAVIAELPDYLSKPLITGQRLVARLSEQNMSKAMEWAKTLKANNLIEEFSLGPTTLEDAYIRIIGREDALELPEGEDSND